MQRLEKAASRPGQGEARSTFVVASCAVLVTAPSAKPGASRSKVSKAFGLADVDLGPLAAGGDHGSLARPAFPALHPKHR